MKSHRRLHRDTPQEIHFLSSKISRTTTNSARVARSTDVKTEPHHRKRANRVQLNNFHRLGEILFLCLCEKRVDNNGGRSQTNIRCLCNNLLSGALSSPVGPALFIIFHPTGSYTILVDKPNILILFFVVVSAFLLLSSRHHPAKKKRKKPMYGDASRRDPEC